MRDETSFARRNVDGRCSAKSCIAAAVDATPGPPRPRLRMEPLLTRRLYQGRGTGWGKVPHSPPSKGGIMNRTILAATLAAAFVFFTSAVSSAQAMQGEHVTEAVKEAQDAVDARNAEQKDLGVQPAQEASTEAGGEQKR